MGQYYQDLDKGHFDYELHPVDGLGTELYRGPRIDTSRPFVACVGAAQTFGRFCHRPYPRILAHQLGYQFANLAVGGTGPGFFDTERYLQVLNRAECVVVQVLSGRSESNSLFDNGESGTLMGTRRTDGRQMRFEEFLVELVKTEAPEVIRQTVQETRDNYVRNFKRFLDHIVPPKVLLWFSKRPPDFTDDPSSPWTLLGDYPQLVNREMIDAIRPHADRYVECVSTQGLPQPLWPASEPIDGTHVEQGLLVNRYYPSPEMHAAAADLLVPECARFLPEQESVAGSEREAGAAAADNYCPFIVLSAERTGSNLLTGLLNSHRDVLCAGELFNPVLIDEDKIPLPAEAMLDISGLEALRRTHATDFLSRLFALAAETEYQAIGFKLMYYHADINGPIRNHLIEDERVRVIHLKRKNLLRRFLSEKRATITGRWGRADPGDASPPRLHLDLYECLADFESIEAKQSEYNELFKRHEVLEVFYEDLADDPQGVGSRCIDFLGVARQSDLAIRQAKMSTDTLPEAIENYGELKSRIHRWASFFDE